MKKIITFSFILVLMSFAATAQSRPGIGFRKGNITRFERIELRNDVARTLILKKRAGKDGVVTPIERRMIRRSKCDTRRDLFRFKHNGRRRII